MQKLALHYDEMLQGSFSLKKLNFLFVFQVNCPGCFLYGIPLINKLFQEFKNEISFLGISTAFEDFEYNNLKNTRLLLEQKKVVGETKKALAQQNSDTFPLSIDFPIAMDKKADASFNFDIAAAQICALNPNYTSWPKEEQTALTERVLQYLKSLESISLTFTLNQLRGTPSLLLFDDNHEVLLHRFGHIDHLEIQKQLKDCIEKFN